MNQTRKNVRSTKAKQTPLETCDTLQLHGKKVRDISTTMYDIRETMFSDQTGQSNMPAERQQIHNGPGWDQQQHHPSWTDEEPQGCKNDTSS